MRIVNNRLLIEVGDTVNYDYHSCTVKYVGKSNILLEDSNGTEFAIHEEDIDEITLPIFLRIPEKTTE